MSKPTPELLPTIFHTEASQHEAGKKIHITLMLYKYGHAGSGWVRERVSLLVGSDSTHHPLPEGLPEVYTQLRKIADTEPDKVHALEQMLEIWAPHAERQTGELDALFDRSEAGPVTIARPGKSDIVILTADAYGALLDKVQSAEFMDGDNLSDDPLLADLAEMASES